MPQDDDKRGTTPSIEALLAMDPELRKLKLSKADVIWVRAELERKSNKSDIIRLSKEVSALGRKIATSNARESSDDTQSFSVRDSPAPAPAPPPPLFPSFRRSSYVKELGSDIKQIRAEGRKTLWYVIGFLVGAGALVIWNWSAMNSRTEYAVGKSTDTQAALMAEEVERSKKLKEAYEYVDEKLDEIRQMLRELDKKLEGKRDKRKR
jgi:hypothetical protein